MPLDRARLGAAPWRVRVVDETGSTNADAIAAASEDAAEGLVIVAESQTAGRGRLGRSWVSPPRAGLWMSMLLRPKVEMARWGWLPLLTGVALADTVRKVARLEAGLKWPNDLLINERKCAGILAEVAPAGAVVVGVGLNVWQTELPVTPTGLPATSLCLEGAQNLDRTELAVEFLWQMKELYDGWQAEPEGLVEAYRARCWTIGRDVTVSLPDDRRIAGVAVTVDSDGRLVVRDEQGDLCPIAAGDVTHVR